MRLEADPVIDGIPAIEDLCSKIALLTPAHGYREPFAIKHQNRVAELAIAMGRAFGLEAQQLEVLRLSAIVHDIGKIAVPAEILGKPGALTGPEFELMKTPCIVGRNILEHLHTPLPIADVAYQHHERLDGSGYPAGLSGTNMLLEARILAVADVYDADPAQENRCREPGILVSLNEVRGVQSLA